jgi:hypothetical protein
MRKPDLNINQLSFASLLAETEAINRQRTEEEAHAHLPDSMEAALPYYRTLIERHNAAMLAGDVDAVARSRSDAHELAYKLNGFNPGILVDEDAPGCVLDRLTRAEEGKVPLWGQSGSFEIQYEAMRVRIEMDGLFGIGATHMSWLSFSAHAIEQSRPFLSDTGYRSFMGVGGALRSGYTPDAFAASIVEAFVERDLKGRLKKIVPITA